VRHTYEIQTCARCDCPIKVSGNLKGKVPTRPMNGIVVDLGYSIGGWGYRQNWLGYSKEVCDECFGEIRAVLQPVIDFLQHPPKRDGDNVSPLRDHEPQSQRRETPLLRKVP
jgi:hypothetical protein